MSGLFYGIIIKKAIGFSVSDLNSTESCSLFYCDKLLLFTDSRMPRYSCCEMCTTYRGGVNKIHKSNSINVYPVKH